MSLYRGLVSIKEATYVPHQCTSARWASLPATTQWFAKVACLPSSPERSRGASLVATESESSRFPLMNATEELKVALVFDICCDIHIEPSRNLCYGAAYGA